MREFDGLDYILIDIANNFGLDKKSWDERIAWTKEHKDHLMDLAEQADSPSCYIASVTNLERTKLGLPIGHPIALDATSSGSQWLACLTQDIDTAKLCNVLPSGKREDIYTSVYKEFNKRTGTEGKIQREHIKKAIMTLK